MNRSAILAGALVALLMNAAPSKADDYFNGFETDTDGWFGNITKVPSSTNGIPSELGSFHAEADGSGTVGTPPATTVFTRWGAYENTFPAAGYVTAVDIYLDFPPPAGVSLQNDMRFDWSSAINDPSGNHRRDFVFNAGYYDDAAPPGAGPRGLAM